MHNLHILIALLKRLRGPQGCTWDQRQTLQSLLPRLIEECYEVTEAFNEHPQDLCEELGDLLFVLLSCIDIAPDISLQNVCRGVTQKMIDRHPHLFQVAAPPKSWEKQKKRSSLLEGIPQNLPALLYAHRQAQKAASVGFDWPTITGVVEKIEEELKELKEALALQDAVHIEHELGDLLMATSNLGRKLNLSAELALKKATQRFAKRFRLMEQTSLRDLDTCSLEELERLWIRAKKDSEEGM